MAFSVYFLSTLVITALALKFVDPKPYDHKKSHVAVKSFRDEPVAYPYSHRHKKPNERWMSWSPVEPRDQDLQHSTLRDVVQEALQPEVNRQDVHTEELGEQRAGTEEPVYTVGPDSLTNNDAPGTLLESLGNNQNNQMQQSASCANFYCHYGRVCELQNDLPTCVCAGVDFCSGRDHRVCGSDGLWYPSHCELHRRACVESRHIGIDHSDACLNTDVQLDGSRSRSERISTDYPEEDQLLDISETPEEVIISQTQPGEDSIETSSAQYDGYDLYDTSDEVATLVCTEMEYERLKVALLQYHCVRIGESGCAEDPAHKQFVANVMFNYYDANEDQSLNYAELLDVSEKDHLSKLSQLCKLTDILEFHDLDENKGIDMQEFYTAFDIPTVILADDVRTFTTIVSIGNSVELKCDIKGSNDLIWKRNGAILEHLTTTQIRTFEDGSLYIGNLGIHQMGNYTCQDRNNDDVIQTHVLFVRMPPTVSVSPATQFHTSNSRVTLKCHTQSIPEAKIQWQVNENDIQDDSEHYKRLHDNHTLVINNAVYTRDTGAYKCKATNTAGTGQDIATVFIENDRVPKYTNEQLYEVFVVFHDKGYTLYEPIHCHIKHTVTPGYSNFKMVSDMLSTPQTLCGNDSPCVWGDAVNVRNKYIYVTQPTLNRIVVIEIEDRSNPVEIITVDKTPVSIRYVDGLDQIWILCWNEDDESSIEKTSVVIRQASVDTPHTIVHTQPIDQQFDKIEDLFLPANNDLGFQFSHGYVVHNLQAGMYKLQLNGLQYDKNIDLANYHCQPKHIAYIPIGGQVLVHCTPLDDVISNQSQLLVLDAITDVVRYVIDTTAKPYVSPDSRYVVLISEDSNMVQVYHVTDNGVLEKRYDTYTSLHVSSVTFFPSERGHGYDLYLTSKDRSTIIFVDLTNGKLQRIENVGDPMSPSEWRWSHSNRVLVSGGVFSEYLVTPARDSLVIIDGRSREVQCEWQDITHANVIVWVKPRTL